MEWYVECPNCGEYPYVGPEPVTCPKCQSTEIDTTPMDGERESQSSQHCDEGYTNDLRFGDNPDY